MYMVKLFKFAFFSSEFLNQAHAGWRLARNWFLEIAFVHDVCMHVCVCVCVSAPKAINN